jgi:hypothetical protein
MKLKDRVLKAVWKEDDTYKYMIAISAREEKEPYDEMYNLESRISFVLLDEKKRQYVEWIPKFGPMTIIEESTNENDEYRKEDYMFDFNKGRSGWSQLACDKNHLNEAFINGDYDKIFSVMEAFFG